MSGMELLILLFCAGGLLLMLATGAWVLVNKSRLEGQAGDGGRRELEALEREYAMGDLDEDEYDARRAEIMRRNRIH
jgi:uncharacterized membrane protein